MKPRIFLSHSKSDKVFVEKIANDLRSARVDAWYDEWEIPPGESFRREITNGIAEADLFFIYFTKNSVNSYWVQHELDTAFIKEANAGRTILAFFVDSEDVRKQLTIDVQAIHSPVFSQKTYKKALCLLLSRAWESYSKRILQETEAKLKTKQLELENQVKTLELTIARSSSAEFADIQKLSDNLKNRIHSIEGKKVSLRYIFKSLANALATSSTLSHLKYLLLKKLGLEKTVGSLKYDGDFIISDVIGPLVILGLIHVQPPSGEIIDDYYYLTELGKKVAANL